MPTTIRARGNRRRAARSARGRRACGFGSRRPYRRCGSRSSARPSRRCAASSSCSWKLEHAGDDSIDLGQHLVERLRLCERPGKAVEDEAGGGVPFLADARGSGRPSGRRARGHPGRGSAVPVLRARSRPPWPRAACRPSRSAGCPAPRRASWPACPSRPRAGRGRGGRASSSGVRLESAGGRGRRKPTPTSGTLRNGASSSATPSVASCRAQRRPR